MNDMNWMSEENATAIAEERSFLKKVEALLKSFPTRENLQLLSSSNDSQLHSDKLERIREAFQIIHQELLDFSGGNESNADSIDEKSSAAQIPKKLYEPIVRVMDCNR